MCFSGAWFHHFMELWANAHVKFYRLTIFTMKILCAKGLHFLWTMLVHKHFYSMQPVHSCPHVWMRVYNLETLAVSMLMH